MTSHRRWISARKIDFEPQNTSIEDTHPNMVYTRAEGNKW